MDSLSRLRVARWPDGAASPVNLMIDDLADVFIPAPGCRGRERDWGHLGRGPDSAWRFVEERLLGRWPELRISLFIPVNRRPLVDPPPGSCFHSIDERPEMRHFLRELAAHPRLECAYHGKDHFRADGATPRQEWENCDSVAAAVAETRRGLDIWSRVFDVPPRGGKYPGYAGNAAADQSIVASGFRWWCRRFSRSQIHSLDTPLEELTPRWFEGGACLNMPSTMAGNVMPPLLRQEWTRWPKRLLQRHHMQSVLRLQLEQLLAAGLPITIQEHIAPSREDGRRQRNNLQDDISALGTMLGMLDGKDVWHAHLSEIADHVRLREQTRLEVNGRELRLTTPETDLLDSVELEILDPRITGFRGEGGSWQVRQSRAGRFSALPRALRHCAIEESPA